MQNGHFRIIYIILLDNYYRSLSITDVAAGNGGTNCSNLMYFQVG